ncbi:MAG: flagellar hook protein FlgE [Armatimonadota bacterium]
MIQAMYNGVSGLRAHKTQMDVISDNIANVNTTGYKASRVCFREMLSQTLRGATEPQATGVGGTNPMQIGLGTSVGSIEATQLQGSLIATGKPTDVAIEGNGFLMLTDGHAKFFTRDGALQLDGSGSLVSAGTGLKLLGWSADPVTGAIDTSLPITPASVLQLPVGRLAMARQTSSVTYGGNLNAMAEPGDSQLTTVQIYDTLGVPHTLSVTFTKTANNSEWAWEATSPDAAPGTVAGSGTVQFDSSGRATIPSGSISLVLASSNGATNPLNATLSFGRVTQLAGETTVSATEQDGLPMGVLNSFTIGKNGIISGVFSNGLTQFLGQISLAQFNNPSGLAKAGNNLLTATPNSGLAEIGPPMTGGLGHLSAGFLESSNVDLATEFADMIVAQRGFQANSRIITASDELLQELVQLKR